MTAVEYADIKEPFRFQTMLSSALDTIKMMELQLRPHHRLGLDDSVCFAYMFDKTDYPELNKLVSRRLGTTNEFFDKVDAELKQKVIQLENEFTAIEDNDYIKAAAGLTLLESYLEIVNKVSGILNTKIARPVPVGVAVLILNSRGHVLMLDHIKHDKLSLPGGKVGRGEEAEVAAMRELYEETGIESVELHKHVMKYDPVINTMFHLYVGLTNDNPYNKEPHKHRSLLWIEPTKENLDGKVNRITRAAIDKLMIS